MSTAIFLSNASVTIAGIDLSNQCQSVMITIGTESQEVSALGFTAGTTPGRQFVSGLQSVEVTLTMFNSYGASEVEATLSSVVGNGTTTLVIQPQPGTPSVTNPRYTISNAMLADFTPITGTVGELSTSEATFTGGTYVRATA